jgi:hypothetical protein
VLVFLAALPTLIRVVLWITLTFFFAILYIVIVAAFFGPPPLVLVPNQNDDFQRLNLIGK